MEAHPAAPGGSRSFGSWQLGTRAIPGTAAAPRPPGNQTPAIRSLSTLPARLAQKACSVLRCPLGGIPAEKVQPAPRTAARWAHRMRPGADLHSELRTPPAVGFSARPPGRAPPREELRPQRQLRGRQPPRGGAVPRARRPLRLMPPPRPRPRLHPLSRRAPRQAAGCSRRAPPRPGDPAAAAAGHGAAPARATAAWPPEPAHRGCKRPSLMRAFAGCCWVTAVTSARCAIGLLLHVIGLLLHACREKEADYSRAPRWCVVAQAPILQILCSLHCDVCLDAQLALHRLRRALEFCKLIFPGRGGMGRGGGEGDGRGEGTVSSRGCRPR